MGVRVSTRGPLFCVRDVRPGRQLTSQSRSTTTRSRGRGASAGGPSPFVVGCWVFRHSRRSIHDACHRRGVALGEFWQRRRAAMASQSRTRKRGIRGARAGCRRWLAGTHVALLDGQSKPRRRREDSVRRRRTELRSGDRHDGDEEAEPTASQSATKPSGWSRLLPPAVLQLILVLATFALLALAWLTVLGSFAVGIFQRVAPYTCGGAIPVLPGSGGSRSWCCSVWPCCSLALPTSHR